VKSAKEVGNDVAVASICQELMLARKGRRQTVKPYVQDNDDLKVDEATRAERKKARQALKEQTQTERELRHELRREQREMLKEERRELRRAERKAARHVIEE
jgi:hypothetical protein